MKTDETSPLISKPNSKPVASEKVAMATAETEYRALAVDQEEREWDGHLLQMCGSCDHEGVSTFAYVKLLTPCAWGHYVQKATGKGFWKHALVFTLLICSWTLYYAAAAGSAGCRPEPRGHHSPLPKPAGIDMGPKGLGPRDLLPGATYNPEFGQLEAGDDLAWVELEDSETVEEALPQEEEANPPTTSSIIEEQQQIQNQIQNAKLQAAESVAQLGAGRKLLHKHKHDHNNEEDDDDEEEEDNEHKKKGDHKHDHKGKHGKDGKQKNKDKSGRKDVERNLPGGKHPEPKDFETPRDGRPSKGCDGVDQGLAALIPLLLGTTIVFLMYAVRMRTAIRKRYGIKGSKCKDCLAWTFCAPCAMCQESRTLLKNNVHNGVWYGKTVLNEPAAEPLSAPTPVEAPTKPV